MKYHKDKYDEACSICKHPNRAEIERIYELDHKAHSEARVARIFELDLEHLKLHIKSLNLDVKKSDKTDITLALLIERGLEDVEKQDISPDLLFKLLRHRDEISGRLKRKEEERPTQILISGNIIVPGALPAPQEEDKKVVIEGEVIPNMIPEKTPDEQEDPPSDR